MNWYPDYEVSDRSTPIAWFLTYTDALNFVLAQARPEYYTIVSVKKIVMEDN